ncbi:hypothetical protein AJ79_03336 [Helicocarpus griseus UAMH5409]|uniref:Major facilitator superfamily (MFS) profile domain-containing protein n=1 Tax=Helicocarpus griseus UAMH5409 TaxID=1447875 RepID=A0A2B7XYR9_9EURO|nr:hypothetical protein AJ79_03336 [Helicocarpus griseus UAMH5409]
MSSQYPENRENSDIASPANHLSNDGKERIKYPGWGVIIPAMTALHTILFLVALDSTILSTAAPQISAQFQTVKDLGWYGSIYNALRCPFVLLSAKVYNTYNPKWVLLCTTAVFELGSAICGAAPSSPVLIFGRALAGIGAGAVLTGAVVATQHLFEISKRPIAINLLGINFVFSATLGPIFGGILTDSFGWRWCFYINLPLGGAGMIMLAFLLHLPSPSGSSDNRMTLKQNLLKFDPIGSITFLASVICLLLALEWGATKYTWSSPEVVALLTVSVILFGFFIGTQLWTQEERTIPPRIIKQRSITCAVLFSLTTGGASSVVAYYLPFWFQSVKGASATQSAIDTLPLAITTLVGLIASGWITTFVGYYNPVMIVSPIFLAIGSGLLSTWKLTTTSSHLILYQVLHGIGLGLGGQIATLAAQVTFDDDGNDSTIGAALILFSRMLGTAVFISVGQSVFITGLRQRLIKAPGFSYQRIQDLDHTRIRDIFSGEILEMVVRAYNDCIARIFFVGVGLGCVGLLGSAGMEWKRIKKDKQKTVSHDGESQEKDKEFEKVVQQNIKVPEMLTQASNGTASFHSR